eukprot:TRINITY_DN4005_c0_g1_i3.p2 TRINITY_DN4005_c0_g1~~TRINITY_DN4005_c0_g1_i3.p2  ORF type:complete len:373 (+),score=184.95 TRINITY_DN4005_c0_g1_i3:1465-2583(+)
MPSKKIVKTKKAKAAGEPAKKEKVAKKVQEVKAQEEPKKVQEVKKAQKEPKKVQEVKAQEEPKKVKAEVAVGEDRMPTTEKAAEALLKFMREKEGKEGKMDLLAEAGPVFVKFDLMQSSAKGVARKRTGVKLPHGIHNRDGNEVCLITTAPQRKWKDKIKAQPEGLENVKKVIDMNKLRKKFKSYEEKRQLATAFNLFVADEAVMNFLPAMLGKVFFARSKEPLCINMKKFPASLKDALASTSYSLRDNNSASILIGRTDFTAAELAENCKVVMADVVSNLTNGWRDIYSVVLKGSDTPGLPIYAHNFVESKENPIQANVFPKRHRLEVPELEEPPAKKAKKEEKAAEVQEESDDDVSELSRISGLDDSDSD